MAVTPVEILPRAGGPRTVDVADRSNLTRSQFLMWLGQQLDPDVPLYNMIQTFRIAGAVDVDTFGRAWQSVVDASDALRSRVIVDGDGVPMRVIDSSRPADIEIVDLRSRADPDGELHAWVEQRKGRTVVLDERLWDSALLLLADDVSVWYLCIHHLVTDGQSFALTYRAMNERYGFERDGQAVEAPALPQYSAYVDHERDFRSTRRAERSRSYWGDLSEPTLPPTEFYGRLLSRRSTATDRLVVEIDDRRSARLRAVAASAEFTSLSEELSVSTLWATVLFATLHRITGRTSIRVGSPFLGRPSRFRDTIGLFIEIGVLQVDIEPDDTFTTLGSRVLRSMVNGLRHATPGAGSAATNRSYDVLFNNVTSRFEDFAGVPVTTDWVHTGHGDRDHALRLQVSDFDESGRFRLHFDLNAELFGDVEKDWLLQQFDVVLDALLDDPAQRLGGFALVREATWARTVVEFNDTDAPYPIETSVVSLFDNQVAATPDAVAVEDAHRSSTYRELAAESQTIAAELIERGVAPGDLVAVLARRSVALVAGILGILRTGAAYVPIDPSYPAGRRRFMMTDASPSAIVVDDPDPGDLGTLDIPVIDLGSFAATPSPTPEAVEVVDMVPGLDALAYLIYTSGSTGTPKGTELTHRGLLNYVWWAKQTYQPDGPLDFPLYSSLAFDLTITSLFVPLISGGRIVVYDRPGEREGLEIVDVMEDDRVDIVKLTPAHLSLLLESQVQCHRIGRLIVGGENFRTDLANAVDGMFPNGVEIFNEYGPTETVVGCMVHRFDAAADTGPSVPIGTPAANSRIYVLDQYDQPVPPGVIGEMVVGSDGVAAGYRNRPELTAERFGDDAFRPGARWYRTGDLARWSADGRLEFLGRNDHQIKIRGARIEPGEIEAAILTHPDVESVVVDAMSFGEIGTGHLEHCVTCGLPSNFPGSDIDASGRCSDCRAYATHRTDVDRYFRTPAELQGALDAARSADRPYDCVVLVSGGKDSTYMLYQLVRTQGIRPLVFTLDNGFIASAALDNVRDACADLGVDLHIGSTSHMNAIFADSLDRHANVCDGCYKTIYTLSMRLAREHGINTIVTGLSRGQLFETRLADTFAAREFDPERIDSWVMEARKAYHHIDDAVYELLETELFNDDSIFEHIGFVDYYRYVDVDLDELYRYLHTETVWTRPPDTGRSTNCLINDVGIYVHSKQRGYHNYALPYSWDVRLGHKQRDAAMDELDDDLDLERVRATLEEIGRGQLFDDLRAERRLVAYYTSSVQVAASDLRHHLTECLPDFMVPTYLVRLDEIPLTVNGKIDRDALPDPRAVRQSDARYRAPRTETERRLVEVWRDALRASTVGIDDNFFDLGGDSITSIQIVAALRQMGWHLSARDVFAHQTIAELAAVTEEAVPGTHGDAVMDDDAFAFGDGDLARIRSQLGPDGGLDGVDDIYPLTSTQLGMLYHTLRTSSRAYFGQGTCILEGQTDSLRLRAAWDIVCRRHPATRVRFLWTGLDEPVQVVRHDIELPWVEHDWRGRPADECDAMLDSLLEQQRDDGFDITAGVLMSLALVQTDERHHLLWNSHHALLDGWSASLLFDEVLDVYERLVDGPVAEASEVPPFRDHVRWLTQQDTSEAAEWWRRRLEGVDAATAIPFDELSPESIERQEDAIRRVPSELVGQIERFAREQRVTLSAIATAAWSLVLGRFGRADDVLFGTTVSGREDSVPGAGRMIGMFINTLPTRVVVDRGADVGSWLRSIQDDALDARRFGHLPLSDLQRFTGVPSGQALFDSIVVVENFPALTVAPNHPLRPGRLEIGAPSNFALAILVHPGDDFRLRAVHDTGRFSHGAAERILGYLEQAMSALTSDARQLVGGIELLPQIELDTLRSWAIGPSAPPAEDLVHDLITAWAATDPDRVAVIDALGTTTYRQLDDRSRAVGADLGRRGIRRGDFVGIVAGTSASHIAALLGVLRIGAVYVPIDASLPPGRLASIVEQTGLRVLLGADEISIADESAVQVAGLDADPGDGSPDLAEPPRPDDLAYVIYTSGSTGDPKGVAVTHANLAHSTTVRAAVYEDEPGTFLLVSSLAFDSSMVGVFWTLCSGGTLVLPAEAQRHTLGALAGLVEEHEVSHLLALPSLYALLLDEHRSGKLASLQTVIVAGESCPTALIGQHQEHCPQATLYNEYGPTEGTVWSHAHRATGSDDSTVPIGRPIPNTAGLVLDTHDHPTPVGVAGELVIGGRGVADGYLGRPDLTARSFVQLPGFSDMAPRWYRTGDLVRWSADGSVEYVGRVDDQVKVRGYRVELAEIDVALLAHPAVRSAATVVVGDTDDARRQLISCYVADPVDDEELRAGLTDRLPSYMVPSMLLRLDEMPSTTTGKIDRRRLAQIASDHAASVVTVQRPATTDLERTLVDIWSSVLDRDDIGIDDDFFDLGGNSLDAMRVFARVERTIGREMLLSTLFEAPTVAEFAALVERQHPTPDNTCLVPIKTTGFKRPFFYVAPYEVSVLELGKIGRHFDRDRPFFGLQPAGLLDGETVHRTIEEMAEHYLDALRSRQPHGPYLIGGHCDGAWVAHEMARQLADRGEEVGCVAMVDLPPPLELRPGASGPRRIVDRMRYYSRDGRLIAAIRWKVKLRMEKWLLLRFGSRASRRVRAVRLAHAEAFGRYRFEHDHRPPLHFIRSTELAVLMDEISWYDEFGTRGQDLVVTDISSTHARLLQEPETVELATVLSEHLDQLDGIR